ncbi:MULTISPECIES: heavy-metal-associated domain-containing protein [Aquimarina]|uniref:heavy-metal-associated domain-containing protein n=1 Tax=Aquimarina TaxID=290174 RepID=UPI000CDE776F|nr:MULTISPECIES: cation transporter [Aquimarina]
MEISLRIQNLKCGGCSHTIISKLSQIENIASPTIDVETSTLSFEYLTKEALALVKNKLSALGYPIEGETNTTITKAKSFVSCAIGKIAKAN